MKKNRYLMSPWMLGIYILLVMIAAVPMFAAEEATAVAVASNVNATNLFRASPFAIAATQTTSSSSGTNQPAKEDSAQTKSVDEIARELANPNNSLASLTFQNQYVWYKGDLPHADDQSNYQMIFQPVFPFKLGQTDSGGEATFFVRPGIPLLVDYPTFDAGSLGFDGVTAIGDIGFDIGYGVTEKNGFLWAYGMVGTLPTATDEEVAGKELKLGPEALFAKFEKWGIYGIFPSHQWDVVGWSGEYYSVTQLQAFLMFLPGDGWNVGSTPIMNYNWDSHEWTVPLNLNVGRTVMFGKTPVRLAIEVNYYVDQPDAFGPEWMIGFNFTPVVNNFIESWIKGN
jgi:hypothetical protein